MSVWGILGIIALVWAVISLIFGGSGGGSSGGPTMGGRSELRQ